MIDIKKTFIIFTILGLTACGKAPQLLSHSQSLNPQFMLASNPSLPVPEVSPQLKYTAINSVFANSSDITNSENINETLLKLRNISSLTTKYHLELQEILKSATIIDFSHLMLMADASYFPAVTYNQMMAVLDDSKTCQDLSPELCQAKLLQVKSNIQSAQDFGHFINQILIDGQPKLIQMTADQAYTLLLRAFPSQESTSQLFQVTLKALPDLQAEEKLSFVSLAIFKSAWAPASNLALDWFKNNSDSTFESLISVAMKFPLSQMRDDLLITGLEAISSLTAPQAKQLSSLALNPLRMSQIVLTKINNVSAHDLSELLSLCQNPAEKDLLITKGISQIKSVSANEAIELIRQASTTNKKQIAQSLISLIPNFKAADLASIAANSAFDQEREEIISANIIRFTNLTAADATLLANQSNHNSARIVLNLLPKINGLQGMELARLVETINSGPARDEALLAGMKLVQTSDILGDIAVLKLAYNTKVEVTASLLAKTPALTTSAVALVAKECLNNPTRDQLLAKGVSLVTQTTVTGAIEVINQATQEKVNLALNMLPKIQNVSASDLGLILKSIADGSSRDLLIANGLTLLKRYDSDGAVVIVERSFEKKLETATKLISLIPKASGTDLDKMLAVCGSGNTRDLILANTIKLLGKLTKLEAKSLYSRAYNNKVPVAVSLMSKVDDFDGKTIAEIALFSERASTRDLIIAEGLKRLAKLDLPGLIAMIKASDKLAEKLAMEVSSRLKNIVVENAVDISKAITNIDLRERFLIHAIDMLKNLDEPSITQLAMAATTQKAKEEIVRKGVEKMGDTL